MPSDLLLLRVFAFALIAIIQALPLLSLPTLLLSETDLNRTNKPTTENQSKSRRLSILAGKVLEACRRAHLHDATHTQPIQIQPMSTTLFTFLQMTPEQKARAEENRLKALSLKQSMSLAPCIPTYDRRVPVPAAQHHVVLLQKAFGVRITYHCIP
jgi:hypothetical protein